MTESYLMSSLLEPDVRRSEGDKCTDTQSRPLDDVIAHAREEITAVFSKHIEKPIAASR